MALLPSSATCVDVVWRMALFGLGLGMGMFQSPTTSAVMCSVDKSRLGVASGVLDTTRSVGMVLSIAVGGAVFYAVTPAAIAQKTVLSATEAVVCLSGLRQAYLVGAVRTVLIAAASVIRPSGNRRATRV
jgi:MFS family permease